MHAQQIIVQGLRLAGHHGVSAEERAAPQLFEVDIVADAASPAAQKSDLLDDTVDYEQMCSLTKAVVAENSYALLERLAAAIAESILQLGGLARVEVTVKKLDPPIDYDVAYTAVRVTKEAGLST